MKYTFKLGTYFDIPVRIHFTFPLILLAFGIEAGVRGGAAEAFRAVVIVLAVFACVVLHEFGHSLQARRYGIRVRDIVLLPIGGMARAERIPDNPWQEIVVAISGPLVNFAIVAILVPIVLLTGGEFSWHAFLNDNTFVFSLVRINLLLGLFNLIPAFPMDGGRILRGLLALRLPYLKATRAAKNIGQSIAILFAIAGFAEPALLMLPLIAVFIFFGAASEERMVRVRVNLDGKQAGDFLPAGVAMLSADDTVDSVAPRVAAAHASALPVTNAQRTMAGAVETGDLERAVRRGRGEEPVRRYVRTGFPLIAAGMPASQAYYLLKTHKVPVAGIVENDTFQGLVYLEDLERAIR